MSHSSLRGAALSALMVASTLFAQSKSAIQFRDSTGSTATAKTGWAGTSANGNYFISTPNDNSQPVTVKQGELTAKKITADGSGLTNIPAGSIAGKIDTAKITNGGLMISLPGTIDGQVLQWDDVHKKGVWASAPGVVIPAGSIDSTKLAPNSVTKVKIAAGSVDSARIAGNSVATMHLRDGSVTSAKIANGAVDSARTVTNAIGTYHLRDGSVTSTKIAAGTIVAADMATGSVDSTVIKDSTVTSRDLSKAVNDVIDSKMSKAGGTFTGTVDFPSLRVGTIGREPYLHAVGSAITYFLGNDSPHMFFFNSSFSGSGDGAKIRIKGSSTALDLSYDGRITTEGCPLRLGSDWPAQIAVGTGTVSDGITLNATTVTVNGTFTNNSDARFKTNIREIGSPLAKALALHGLNFDFNQAAYPDRAFPKGTQIGFLAQDVEKIVPEIVHTDDEGYKSVAYQNVTALVVEALKEQQKQIDSLRHEIAEMKAKQSE